MLCGPIVAWSFVRDDRRWRRLALWGRCPETQPWGCNFSSDICRALHNFPLIVLNLCIMSSAKVASQLYVRPWAFPQARVLLSDKSSRVELQITDLCKGDMRYGLECVPI